MRRRDFLKGLTAAGVACKRPETLVPTEPIALPPGIDHVVFVMMENRSFDHLFGSLTLEEGRTDVDGLTAAMQNTSSQGVHTVYPLSSDWCLEDPPHGWSSTHRQFAEGANTGFASEYHSRHGDTVDAGLVMGYINRAALPVSYALADAYTLCDQWYCALLGPTWPNRLYAHTGESDGAKGNDLPDGGQFTQRSLWNQLDDAGVSWNYFYSDLPFIGIMAGTGGWVQAGKVTGINAFYQACENGTLPSVCWVDPGFGFNDDHPPHHPLLGQMFLATVHNALAASPQWARTLLIITYDEHGGFYDHVAPPVAADDREDFRQYGFRVPALICGPWARAGFVDHTLYSHCSWLSQVQAMHGLDPLTARNAAAADLSNALDLTGEPRPPATLPVIGMTEEEVMQACSSERAANQPELEAVVRDRWPHLDLRGDDLLARHIAWAEHFGACVVD